jgi:ubiquitin C-terminal hydrolase
MTDLGVQPVSTMTEAMLSVARHGLANIGNTCYLNSAIQALQRTTVFSEYLGSDAWRAHCHSERKSHPMTEELAGVMAALSEEGTKTVIPAKFVHQFIDYAKDFNDDIGFGAQADAAEAIQIILDGVHMALAREVRMEITGRAVNPAHAEIIRSHESWISYFRKEYSPVVEKFYTQIQNKIVCGKCGASSTRYEPSSVLKLPIPGAERAGAPAPTLQECLRSYMEPETLDEYRCDSCKAQGEAKLSHAISRYPQYLVMSLKRFTNTGAKVRARIPYDENLIDLSEWRAFPDITAPAVAQYRLIVTVEHLGGSRGGHYCMRSRKEDGWYMFDDTRVGKCSDGNSTPDTYMLILEKIAV